ncbi:hypothetical protein GJ744_010336 [Endocarpon pusillum]|uniref:Protein kinase domain-containing protein n=1 Tax=Endocarpon pusillum TaxID=364733 RepID=A0A8H7AM01_9EURO|nr:hypothetical protein GJ744_010336 [Endocarpon pusillum]
MYDHNVFGVLTARDPKNKASSAFNLPHNAKWFRKAAGGIAEEPTIDSREPTPAPQTQSAKEDSAPLIASLLKPKGSAEEGDVATLLWAWIEFPNHEAADPQYIETLRAFVKQSKEAVPPVNGLGLESDLTAATPSQAQTAGERTIYFNERRIGKGTFGERFILPTNKRKRDELDPVWQEGIRREFIIMGDNPHPNVMRVMELWETPEPLIVMDYYDLGNIIEAGVAYDQYVTAVGQILDSLDHLHAKGVAHRDLKAENLLVERVPFFKFASPTLACPRL